MKTFKDLCLVNKSFQKFCSFPGASNFVPSCSSQSFHLFVHVERDIHRFRLHSGQFLFKLSYKLMHTTSKYEISRNLRTKQFFYSVSRIICFSLQNELRLGLERPITWSFFPDRYFALHNVNCSSVMVTRGQQVPFRISSRIANIRPLIRANLIILCACINLGDWAEECRYTIRMSCVM